MDKKIIDSSREVIRDCCLPNGAIVAANSTKDYYPEEAKYYKYVWPRDAMYTCLAANILGIDDVQEKFFKWCMKAEGWKKTGLFYEKYHIDGKKAKEHFQPDQTGSVLIALHDHYKGKEKSLEFKELISRSADGLCKVWDDDHFNIASQDLWEERLCFPDLKDNFTYSLAICSRGLECANELVPNKKWIEVSRQMKNILLKQDNFHRSFGRINYYRIDASLLGLVWPSGIVSADDMRMKKTVKQIEDRIVKNKGVFRYENDEYDGWMYKGKIQRKKGAGYWPLLNFWMSIYHIEAGNKKKALSYYYKVMKDLKGKEHIPEQIFDNDIQVSVSPLCWSHAMFVIASKRLGKI